MLLEKRRYSYLDIAFPDDVKTIFLNKGKSVVQSSILSYKGSGGGYEENPHVTILYGLHSPVPTVEMLNIVETHPKFTITLGLVSLFKSNDFDVVKVDVSAPDLYALRSAFINSTEYTLTFSEFIPHATIAYVKHGTCDYLDGLTLFKGLSFVAQHVGFHSFENYDRLISMGIR